MRCSKCETESTSGRKFCPECGSPLSNRCSKCRADNSPTTKFCEIRHRRPEARQVSARRTEQQSRVLATPLAFIAAGDLEEVNHATHAHL
ncbi:MAG: zinc ribbon domain-containing protein [Candidatus Binatus sp.]